MPAGPSGEALDVTQRLPERVTHQGQTLFEKRPFRPLWKERKNVTQPSLQMRKEIGCL